LGSTASNWVVVGFDSLELGIDGLELSVGGHAAVGFDSFELGGGAVLQPRTGV
jgi:hypothetical protein